MRDNYNSPRIIEYYDINCDYHSRNLNSQYGGGQQSFSSSRYDRGQNNRPSQSYNKFYDDPRQYDDYPRFRDDSNQYQDERGFISENRRNRYTNDSNIGRASNNSRSRQDQSGYEPRSQQSQSSFAPFTEWRRDSRTATLN